MFLCGRKHGAGLGDQAGELLRYPGRLRFDRRERRSKMLSKMPDTAGKKQCLVICPFGADKTTERKRSDTVLKSYIKPVAQEAPRRLREVTQFC